MDNILKSADRGAQDCCTPLARVRREGGSEATPCRHCCCCLAHSVKRWAVAGLGVDGRGLQVLTLSLDETFTAETLRLLSKSGYSRIPVYEYRSHNLRGYISIKVGS